ncbi:MAG: hypothetical protein LC803_09220 [Acidobacteria bacterium]|nr:hypothetical protein [Acidobacteriota bacterium]
MSKKQDRTSREADLPDWADEVTPADEVMEKFYAPTGAFRSGPVSIPKESVTTPPDIHDESAKDGVVQQFPPRDGIDTSDTSHISAEDSQPQEDIYKPPSELEAAISSVPVTPKKSSDTARPMPQLTSENTIFSQDNASATIPPPALQSLPFEEFASRWKRYLYPGQIAVMRTLYELTFPQGTSECFTRYSELAASTKMSRRNCINVMNSLVDRGFVERLEIRNDATGKGIKLRVHLEPLR